MTWEEWLAQLEIVPVYPHRIKEMWALYGKSAHECRNCGNLMRFKSRNKQWTKCKLARVSASAATDWQASWPGCGKHTENKNEQD